MKLQIIEEPDLAFHQNKLHIDIRAGFLPLARSTKVVTQFPFQFELV